MKRNTIVIGVTLLILAAFAWAGWANWEYRKQAAERALASAAHADLIPVAPGDVPQSQTSLVGKPAPDFVLEDLSGRTVASLQLQGQALADQLLGNVVRPLQDRNAMADRTAK